MNHQNHDTCIRYDREITRQRNVLCHKIAVCSVIFMDDRRCEILVPNMKLVKSLLLRCWRRCCDLARESLYASWIAAYSSSETLLSRIRVFSTGTSPSFRRFFSPRYLILVVLFRKQWSMWERAINDLFRPEFPNRKFIAQWSNDRKEIIVHVQLCRRWNYESPYYTRSPWLPCVCNWDLSLLYKNISDYLC